MKTSQHSFRGHWRVYSLPQFGWYRMGGERGNVEERVCGPVYERVAVVGDDGFEEVRLDELDHELDLAPATPRCWITPSSLRSVSTSTGPPRAIICAKLSCSEVVVERG
jgi:hypothetical protein